MEYIILSLRLQMNMAAQTLIEKRDYTVITSPKADFITTNTLSPCSPFLASFTTTSSLEYSTDGITCISKNQSCPK